jgi:hypothetical protein
MTAALKVSGVARVDDPQPRLRFEWSGIAFLDREDVAALVAMIEAPAPPPPLFSVEEQRRHATEYNAKLAREVAAKAAQRAADEDRFREQFPELAEELLPEKEQKRPEHHTYVIGDVPVSM